MADVYERGGACRILHFLRNHAKFYNIWFRHVLVIYLFILFIFIYFIYFILFATLITKNIGKEEEEKKKKSGEET